MNRNAWRGTRLAVVCVGAAMLFGVLGSGAAAPALAATPGLCNPREVVEQRAGFDAGVCVPFDSYAITKRLKELAADPVTGAITSRSMQKAWAALGLELTGQLPAPVRRDPTGAADFIDGSGRSWNAYDAAKLSPRASHDLRGALMEIGVDLLQGQNVILITENLSPQATAKLKAAVDSAGLRDRVILWPGVSSTVA